MTSTLKVAPRSLHLRTVLFTSRFVLPLSLPQHRSTRVCDESIAVFVEGVRSIQRVGVGRVASLIRRDSFCMRRNSKKNTAKVLQARAAKPPRTSIDRGARDGGL